MPIHGINSDRLMFGQFLIDLGRTDLQTLAKALKKQQLEGLTKHHRRLGVILWKDYNVFVDRVDLYRVLADFEKYRDEIKQVYHSLEYYSNLYLEDLDGPEK